MDYVKYECLVCWYGVELSGWTEPTIGQPGAITTSLALIRLADALRMGDCYWMALNDKDWDTRKEAHLQAIHSGKVPLHKKHKDAGLSNILKCKGADKARHGIDGESSDEESNEGDE